MELSEEELKSQNIPPNSTITVTMHGHVAVIKMLFGQNRLNVMFIKELNKALDQVEKDPNVHIVITTSDGKFYSNGIDLEFLLQLEGNDNSAKGQSFLREFLYQIYQRILTFPKVTIAAINGHCFAGGMLLSICHDYRVMNDERGWMCMNEVHINTLFPPFLLKLLEKRLPNGHIFHEVLAMGKRYTAAEALQAGLVNKTCASKDLLNESIALGKSLTARGPYNESSLWNMKNQLYEEVLNIAKL